jgi:membrane protease YdiL (CAAX protease family)
MTKSKSAWWPWVALVFALVWPTAFTLVYFLAVADLPSWAGQLAYATGKTIQFAFPIAWLLLYEKPHAVAPPAVAHLRRRDLSALAGIAFGLFVGGVMFAGYYWWLRPLDFFTGPAQAVAEKLADFEIDTPERYVALAVFYSLLHSALEEYYWRWFVFRRLSWLSPLPIASAVSSVGFMLHHVIPLALYFGWTSPAAWFFILSVGVGGAFWAWLYSRYHSLLGPWLSHLLIDAAIFAIGYDLVESVAT